MSIISAVTAIEANKQIFEVFKRNKIIVRESSGNNSHKMDNDANYNIEHMNGVMISK